MNRQVLDKLAGYLSAKTDPTEQEKELLAKLKKEAETFWIAYIDRDTLMRNGYDVDGLSDDDMVEIAGSIGDSYCGSSKFDNDICEVCEEYGLENTPECPRCEFSYNNYDPERGVHHCHSCNRDWSDDYVLVEFPDNVSYFEKHNIGYPSFGCRDNGARYVPEYNYIWHFKKDPAPNSYFKPLRWPESQPYLFPDKSDESVDALCEPIGDEKGIADFGEQAVWVPLCNLKNQDKR